jgi:predicted nucleotidyltransferase component of viral defense system
MMLDGVGVLDLAGWVAKAPADKKNFREAVHIILTAIGASTVLRGSMILKGGMLMALRYDSSRFTRDADFSTAAKYSKGDEHKLLEELGTQLVLSNAASSYDAFCQIQHHSLKPPGPDKSFPTLALNIGYAARSNARALQRLLAGQSPTVVEIDYSYNEAVLDVEMLRLAESDILQVYSLVNLMAEKFRSLLQQPVRNRHRRQDIYDLWLLMSEVQDWTSADRRALRDCIVASAQSRGLRAELMSLRDPRVIQMAAMGYRDMEAEIDGPLPEFDTIYLSVQKFYENLPWI